MRGFVKAALGNLKEVAMWLAGVIVGLIVVANEHYLVGLGIAAFCAFMTKVALADGVRSNAILAAHMAKQLAEMQMKRKRESASVNHVIDNDE